MCYDLHLQKQIRGFTVDDSAKMPSPSCPLKPLFYSEVKCEAIDIEIIFYSHANKTHFHEKC